MTLKQTNFTVDRIYPEEPKEIVEKKIEKSMNISIPIFTIGYKDTNFKDEIIKRHISIEIILNIILGRSSRLFKKLYEEGKVFSEFGFNYEFANTYAHVLIQGQTADVEYVVKNIEEEIEKKRELIPRILKE
jgi:predicted Zn-dependent peptidase